MPSTETQLPRILCFHGGGSSAAIFRFQSRKIEHALRHRFRLVFIDAPFESTPGPGILPIFEGAGPYHRWHCDVSAASYFDITLSEIAAERRLVRQQLDRILRAEEEDGAAPFVGVMGFSQGTRVATGLLIDQHQKRQQRQHQKDHLPHLRFAVLLCGTYPPLPLTDDPMLPAPATNTSIIDVDSAASASSSERYDVHTRTDFSEPALSSGTAAPSDTGSKTSEAEPPRIRIPSVHVHGLQDPWLREGRELLKNHYDTASATVIEFQGSHHVPSAQKDIDEVVRAIISASEASAGLDSPT